MGTATIVNIITRRSKRYNSIHYWQRRLATTINWILRVWEVTWWTKASNRNTTSSSTLHLLQRNTLSMLIRRRTSSMPSRRRGKSSNWRSSFWDLRAHQSGPKLHFSIKRMGYYWTTIVKDCVEYVKKCQSCQFHSNFIHQPLELLHLTIASWPFDAWGLDLIGFITPKSSARHAYILATTNIFLNGLKLCHL